MAHPFPPGSTLQSHTPTPTPSLPLYITIHITIEENQRETERGVDSPILLRTNPGQSHKPLARADVGGFAYAIGFVFVEPN